MKLRKERKKYKFPENFQVWGSRLAISVAVSKAQLTFGKNSLDKNN